MSREKKKKKAKKDIERYKANLMGIKAFSMFNGYNRPQVYKSPHNTIYDGFKIDMKAKHKRRNRKC